MTGSPEQRFPSPLRYPGGKGKIANFIKLIFTKNRLAGVAYAEPYAGGASVALHLLFEEYASHIYINDINRSVFEFWYAVLNSPDALCARISNARLSMPEWRRQQEVQQDSDALPLDLAFSTFYMNRCNRSGIIWAGVIGGKKQDGPWKLDARFHKRELIRRIEKIARFRSRITLTNHDTAHWLASVYPKLGDDLLTYLDPPYYVKGSGLYENFYVHDDHAAIARAVREMRRPWIVSYDAAAEVLELYAGYRRITYGLTYSAADRYAGAEVMFFSPSLAIPQAVGPANIKCRAVQRARMASLAGADSV